MTLDRLKPGNSAQVTDIEADHILRRRMMELGVTPGTKVSVVRVAPMGDPIEIKVRGYRLSLRKADAASISCTNRGE